MYLRLADKCFYRVDFLVLIKEMLPEVHEINGGFMTDDLLVKFKARERVQIAGLIFLKYPTRPKKTKPKRHF